MRAEVTLERRSIGGRRIELRRVRSKLARKVRVRVGIDGVEVLQPAARPDEEVEAFLAANAAWILSQVDRAARLAALRRAPPVERASLLLHGVPTGVRIDREPSRTGTNRVTLDADGLRIALGSTSRTAPAKSLEGWLRRRARELIERLVAELGPKVDRAPNRVYVMDQRTKWGNCSALGNLSFSWRIVLAPDFVARYLVAHELVHLVVPDHSPRFWLTLNGVCRDVERARQWLVANGAAVHVALEKVVGERRGGEVAS